MVRRTYWPRQKAQVVLQVLSGEKGPAQVARRTGCIRTSVGLWKRQFLDRAPEIFSEASTVKEYERRILELEELIGKKEVEIAPLTLWGVTLPAQ